MAPVILIYGLPGVGKTAVAELVAKRFSKSLHLEVDQLRAMMANGLILPGDTQGWNEELDRQFRLERSAASRVAETYARGDVTVVLDDVSIPPAIADHYQDLSPVGPLYKFLLMAETEVLQERLKKRASPMDKQFLPAIPMLNEHLKNSDKADWDVIQTTGLTLEQIAVAILDAVSQS